MRNTKGVITAQGFVAHKWHKTLKIFMPVKLDINRLTGPRTYDNHMPVLRNRQDKIVYALPGGGEYTD